MYSVILMAALTTNTAEAPQWMLKGGGCMGGLYLHSGSYGSCMGCWGAAWGGFGGGCQGCWGFGSGWWGAGYGGEWGAGYGGGWGAGYGGYANGWGCYGCMGCHGAFNGYGDYMTPAPAYTQANPIVVPSAPAGAAPAAGGTGTPPATPGTTGRAASYGTNTAKLTIEKPADARLFVDDIPVLSDQTSKSFVTPTLAANQAYYYTVRVEMTRAGKPVAESRRVVVRAGDTITETFRDPAAVGTASLKMPLAK
jgi:uncharacterized protein (TIGR03000 family)